MLINLSNHPYSTWDKKEKEIAESLFGKVVDLSFPQIDPLADIKTVALLANDFVEKCINILLQGNNKQNAVHVTGEHCFVFQFVTIAKEKRLTCICSTTPRIVTSKNNIKSSIFKFESFRNYY